MSAEKQKENIAEDEVCAQVFEVENITDAEIENWGITSEYEKKIVKEQYAKYPKGFFKNPICALH